MARTVYLDFQDGSGFRNVSSLVKYDTLEINIGGYSDTYHYVQNTASFEIIYNSVIYPLLQSSDKDIIVRIIESVGSVALFYGIIPMNRISYQYNGILNVTSIKLEAEDHGTYLDKPVGGSIVGGIPTIDVCYRNYQLMNTTLSGISIVHQLAYLAGFSNSQIDSSVTISGTLNAFVPPSSSDSIRDLMDALLFEYGYTLHFNEAGQISPIKWIQNAVTPVTAFTESNMIDKLGVQNSIKTYKGAEVVYYELEEGVTTSGQTDILLYRDSELPYDSNGAFLGYPIISGYTYPPETNVLDETTGQKTKVYQVYEDSAIQYWTNAAIKNKLDYNYKAFTSDFSSIVATSGWRLDYSAGANVSLVTSEFYNTQARVVYSGMASTNNNLYYSNIYGKILYKTAERTSKIELVANTPDINEYVSTFIFDKTSADTLVKGMVAQYSIDQVQYSVTASGRINVGTRATVVAGDGTNATTLVSARKYDEKSQLYQYTLKNYSAATPSLTSQTTTHASSVTAASMLDTFATKAVVADATKNLGVKLLLSTSNVSRSRTGALTPSEVVAYGRYSDNTTYSGIFVINVSADGSYYQNSYTSSGLEASKAFTVPATVTISGTPYYTAVVKFKLYEDATLTTEKAEAFCDVQLDSSTTPLYLGRYDHAHPTTYLDGDWWTVYDTDDSPIQRGVWYSNGGTPVRITASGTVTQQAKFGAAFTDVAWAEAQGTYGTAADYGIETLFQSLGAVTAFINSLFVQQITVPAGGRIRYETGAGVQKRCVQLADEKIDFLDIPDTVPASDELLRFRLGRLGVGSAVLADGELMANITTPWSAKTIALNEVSGYSSIIQRSDSAMECSFQPVSDNYLYTIEKPVGGSWSAKTLALGEASEYSSLVQTSDGTIICMFRLTSDGKLYTVEKQVGGSWSAKTIALNESAIYPSLIQKSDGTLMCMFTLASDSKLYTVEKQVGGSWSAKTIALNESAEYSSLVQTSDGTLMCMFTLNSGGYLYTIEKPVGGSWSAKTLALGEAATESNLKQRLDGSLECSLRISPSGYLYTIEKPVGGSWSAKTLALGEAVLSSSLVQKYDGMMVCMFKADSDGKLYTVEKQVYARVGAGIIESGSNANGSYIKFSDGTMQQWGIKTTSALTTSNPNAFGSTSGQSYYNGESDVVYFPANFIDTNFVVSVSSIGYCAFNYSDKAVGTLGRVYAVQTTSGGTKNVEWFAIGRWK